MTESVYTLEDAARRINKACFVGGDFELTPRLLIQMAFEKVLPFAIRVLLAGEVESSEFGQFSLSPKVQRNYFEVPREELIQFELVDVISVSVFFIGEKEFSLRTPRNIRIEDCRIWVSDVVAFINGWKYSAQRTKALMLAAALGSWQPVPSQVENNRDVVGGVVHSTKGERDSSAMNPVLTKVIETAETQTTQGYWAALIKLADEEDPMHPLLGYEPATWEINEKGKNVRTPDSIKISGRNKNYTFKNMRESMQIKQALGKVKPAKAT